MLSPVMLGFEAAAQIKKEFTLLLNGKRKESLLQTLSVAGLVIFGLGLTVIGTNRESPLQPEAIAVGVIT